MYTSWLRPESCVRIYQHHLHGEPVESIARRYHRSKASIYRIIKRADLVTAEPAKRPKVSYTRFQAEQPNECWQADFTHWRLANGKDTEILLWLDDHSRFIISATCHRPVTGRTVVKIGSGA